MDWPLKGRMNSLDAVLSLLASPVVPRLLLKALVRAIVGILRWRLVREDARQATAQPTAPAPAGRLYLVDGYHGGIVFWDWLVLPGGGLWLAYNWPLCVQPALERAARDRRFKAVFDWDAYTLEEMARLAPWAIEIMRQAITAAQLEFVNGTYAQPLARLTSGESFLRQLRYGLRAVRETLGTDVTVFYSQEPAYFPQLPQLLANFGYEGVVLRTQWAAFGTDPAQAATLVRWQGPDGSVLPTVPRYPFQRYDRLRATHRGLANMALSMADDRPDWEPESLAPFEQAARQQGIAHPLVTDLKDTNLPDAPWRRAVEVARMENVRLVTVGEYLNLVSHEGPLISYDLDDIPSTLPWGLQGEMLVKAQAAAEGELLVAERLDAIAYVLGRTSDERRLAQAWKSLCLAQHHDLYICGPWHSKRHGACMAQVGQEYAAEAQRVAHEVKEQALRFLARHASGDLLVFNPSPWPRREYIEVACPRGLPDPPMALVDDEQTIPCQLVSQSDEDWVLGLVVDLPSLGFRTFRFSPDAPNAGCGAPSFISAARFHSDGSLSLESEDGVESLAGNYFTAWRDGTWHDSRSSVQRAEWIAQGPVLRRYRVEGEVAGVPFVQHTTVYQGLPRIDVSVAFDFGEETYLGPQMADDRPDRAMAIQDEKKLCVAWVSPATILCCDSPFLISQTGAEHVVGVHWVGLEDRVGTGIAILNRGTRGHHFDRERGLLRNVLAWAPEEWPYASDDSIRRGRSRYTALRGWHSYEYAIQPYGSRVEAQRAALDYHLTCQTFVLPGQSHQPCLSSRSFLNVSPDKVLVTALYVQEGRVLAHLWNCSDRETIVRMHPVNPVRAVSLDLTDEEVLMEGLPAIQPWGVQAVEIEQG